MSHLLRSNTDKHLLRSSTDKHLLRMGDFNRWINCNKTADRYCYNVANSGNVSLDSFYGVQNFNWEQMYKATAWNNGWLSTTMYAGQRFAPSQYGVYATHESFCSHSANFFSLPSWCGGTTVTAARALINSPGHLRKNASSSDYWDYTWSKSALRVRAAASLLSPIAVLQSDYAQVMTTTLTSWTKALAPGVLLSDLWNWEDIYHYVPYFAGAQNTWYPINLNSAAVSLLNTNRGCWLHSGWTQDYVDYGIDYRITNAGVAGIALQVYVV